MKLWFLTASLVLALTGVAGAQPQPRDYRTGYDDGYNDCIAGGVNAPPRVARDYQRGYRDGYRACTLGPQGTANSAGAPVVPGSPPPGSVDASGWAMLGASSLGSPSEKLMVGKSAGRFSRVRIQATAGAPRINAIDVRFLDSSLQSFPVGRTLRPGEVLEFALSRAQPISSITVTGAPDPNAAYRISAAR
jgi:hypothetical protein